MITTNTWVRDTLIRIDVLNQLPEDRRLRIIGLYNEFKSLGYIDARTEIGPSQYARMSEKRRNEISKTASRVFAIEQQIKELMKSDEQIAEDQRLIVAKNLAEQKRQIEHRIKTIEQYLSRQLNSNRSNITKREYAELQKQLQNLAA